MAKELDTKIFHGLSGKKVAVTGATGMLGGEFVRRLSDTGALIRLVVRNESRLKPLLDSWTAEIKPEIVECELVNPVELPEAFAGIDVVFHCAAQVSFHLGKNDDLVRTNTDITHHVVNACLDAGVGRLVHVSSIASLGEANDQGVIDESCYPYNVSGWNDYSLSKFYSENEVWRGIRCGLDAVIVNPSVILGPGDWKGRGSAALFAAMASGTSFYVPGVNGYVDVRDVADALILLVSSPEAAGKRFVLNGANLSYKELIELSARSVGRKLPKYKVGAKTLNCLHKMSVGITKLTGGTPLLTKEIVKAALAENRYGGEAVKEVVDFEYRPIEETIRYMASAYLEDKIKK